MMKYLDANAITRYYTPDTAMGTIIDSLKREKTIAFYKDMYNVNDVNEIKQIAIFRTLGCQDAYKAPHFVIKKGLDDNKLCASFINVDCSFRDGVYGFYSNNSEILKVLMAYFNSKLSAYFIFMTNSSYGIEREQIMKEEFLSIPIDLTDKSIKEILDIISAHLETAIENDLFENGEFHPEASKKIENIIYKSLNFTAKDIAIINDMIDYTLDLFHNREKSRSLCPTKDIIAYAEMLCDEINDFLVDRELYVNPTLYEINNETPLGTLKLSFQSEKKKRTNSDENIDTVLKKINQNLWRKAGCNIYFRKKLNYYDGDDIFIIRPNQKRFWTQSAAINDAFEIILECLQGNDKA